MKKHRQIRSKPHTVPPFMAAGACISREQALRQVHALLTHSPLHPEALQLITLFHIDPEELTEAGLSYETLKTLERRALFF